MGLGKMESVSPNHYVYEFVDSAISEELERDVEVDWTAIEADVRETLEIGRDSCLEMVMKSTETFGGDPARLTQWGTLAKRLAEESVG